MAALDRPGLKTPESKNPYQSNLVSGWSLTYGTEANDMRTITGRFRGQTGGLAQQRLAADFYLSADTGGEALVTPPSLGIQVTSGLFHPYGNSLVSGLTTDGNLAISVTATQFKTTQIATYLIGGRTYTKAATDNLTFTAAHVVTGSLFGIILVQINAAGTISTKVPLATQAYASAPLALAAIPAPDAGNVKLGHIAIAAAGGGFTANTTALTTIATFVDGTEVIPGPVGGKLVTGTDGTFGLIVGHAGAKTFYPTLVLPNGKVAVGPALAFT